MIFNHTNLFGGNLLNYLVRIKWFYDLGYGSGITKMNSMYIFLCNLVIPKNKIYTSTKNYIYTTCLYKFLVPNYIVSKNSVTSYSKNHLKFDSTFCCSSYHFLFSVKKLPSSRKATCLSAVACHKLPSGKL